MFQCLCCAHLYLWLFCIIKFKKDQKKKKRKNYLGNEVFFWSANAPENTKFIETPKQWYKQKKKCQNVQEAKIDTPKDQRASGIKRKFSAEASKKFGWADSGARQRSSGARQRSSRENKLLCTRDNTRVDNWSYTNDALIS
jgi:hypothetical protein